jgi:hypothetical protein
MSVTFGHWQLTMVIRLRHVGRQARPRTTLRPAPSERIARRTMRHQDAETDQARWWVNAYSCSRIHTLR